MLHLLWVRMRIMAPPPAERTSPGPYESSCAFRADEPVLSLYVDASGGSLPVVSARLPQTAGGETGEPPQRGECVRPCLLSRESPENGTSRARGKPLPVRINQLGRHFRAPAALSQPSPLGRARCWLAVYLPSREGSLREIPSAERTIR